ncbi:hypothetical protein [Roseivirga echinicomitans]|uniref:Uncharacterized protein n=1 Tax=Roseivirga echinicomitans TaxID=296218 RepID=A0A150XEM9_9BACT|nr:hypothetical protein [Roseivirga echinicomitans]KYG77160.1 hypothetical protein AWN68_18175 [Roseivirga echinicomitans]
MNYLEQLLQPEWKLKRTEVLKRDNNCCQICFNEKVIQETIIGLTEVKEFEEKLECTKLTVIGKGVKILKHEIFNYPFEYSNAAVYLKEIENRQKVVAIRVLDHMVRTTNQVSAQELFEDGKSLEELIYDQETIFELNKSFSKNFKWLYGFNLQVHHECYRQSRMAWEYENEDLLTLCWQCHEDEHKEKKIPVYSTRGDVLGEYTRCNRCFGAGRFPEYNHVQKGICFRCIGKRFEELIDQV